MQPPTPPFLILSTPESFKRPQENSVTYSLKNISSNSKTLDPKHHKQAESDEINIAC